MAIKSLTSAAAAPLGLVDMNIRIDKDVFLGCGSGDSVPDLEPSGVLGPAGVLVNDFSSHLGAVDIAQSIDHGHLKWHIQTLAIIYLINHFDRISPVSL